MNISTTAAKIWFSESNATKITSNIIPNNSMASIVIRSLQLFRWIQLAMKQLTAQILFSVQLLV